MSEANPPPSPSAAPVAVTPIEFEHPDTHVLMRLIVAFESPCGDYGGTEPDERDATPADLIAALRANEALRYEVLKPFTQTMNDLLQIYETDKVDAETRAQQAESERDGLRRRVEELEDALRACESLMTESLMVMGAHDKTGHHPEFSDTCRRLSSYLLTVANALRSSPANRTGGEEQPRGIDLKTYLIAEAEREEPAKPQRYGGYGPTEALRKEIVEALREVAGPHDVLGWAGAFKRLANRLERKP